MNPLTAIDDTTRRKQGLTLWLSVTVFVAVILAGITAKTATDSQWVCLFCGVVSSVVVYRLIEQLLLLTVFLFTVLMLIRWSCPQAEWGLISIAVNIGSEEVTFTDVIWQICHCLICLFKYMYSVEHFWPLLHSVSQCIMFAVSLLICVINKCTWKCLWFVCWSVIFYLIAVKLQIINHRQKIIVNSNCQRFSSFSARQRRNHLFMPRSAVGRGFTLVAGGWCLLAY